MYKKDEKDIGVFLNVRKDSHRCWNKMLRPFADSTLVDICLDKVAKLNWHPIYYGAYEEELLEKASRYKRLIPIRRSYESAHNCTDGRIVFEMLRHIPTRWVIWINPCHPFLTVDTISKAIKCFRSVDNNALTSVVKRHNWFYSVTGELLTNRAGSIDTKESDFLLEVAHAFHMYDRQYILEAGKPWPQGTTEPYLFEIPDHESYDVDTEEEFAIAEFMYQRKIR